MKRFRKDLGDLTELKRSIQEVGQIHPVVEDKDGNLIAGARRLAACEELGIKPLIRVVDFDNPEQAQIDENVVRKDFVPSEIDAITKYYHAKLSRQGANQHTKKSDEHLSESDKSSPPRDVVASIVGKHPDTISKIAAIFERGDEKLQASVDADEISVDRAYRKIKNDERHAENEKLKSKKVKTLSGLFDVIVIDPPWQIEKIERDCAPNQTKTIDYPTMTIDEITSWEMPMESDCHIFMWTTHRYLPAAIEIIKAWGLKYVLTMVWHKPGGFQPFGLPQYNCEFAVYSRNGSPRFIDLKNFPVCFNAPRGKHSEKPDYFYELIKRVTSGRRLDDFARGPHDGFETRGNECQ